MPHPATRFVSTLILLSAIFIGAGAVGADSSSEAALAVAPFLYPPYPGAASQNSIFDHSSPNYSSSDNLTVMFNHDVIDGAPAARFTRRLVELIESGYGLDGAQPLTAWSDSLA